MTSTLNNEVVETSNTDISIDKNIYTCYGCADERKEKSELRYECMCTEKKGICKMCVDGKPNLKLTELKIPIPPHHNIQKLHDLTPEYSEFWATIESECGKRWSGMSCTETSTEIHYYEGPNGERDGALLTAYPLYDYVDRDTYKRTKTFPLPPKQMCTCC